MKRKFTCSKKHKFKKTRCKTFSIMVEESTIEKYQGEPIRCPCGEIMTTKSKK